MAESEGLASWWWVAHNPAKPTEKKKYFECVTYIEARAKAATWFRIPETVVHVRVLFEHEIEAAKARKAAA